MEIASPPPVPVAVEPASRGQYEEQLRQIVLRAPRTLMGGVVGTRIDVEPTAEQAAQLDAIAALPRDVRPDVPGLDIYASYRAAHANNRSLPETGSYAMNGVVAGASLLGLDPQQQLVAARDMFAKGLEQRYVDTEYGERYGPLQHRGDAQWLPQTVATVVEHTPASSAEQRSARTDVLARLQPVIDWAASPDARSVSYRDADTAAFGGVKDALGSLDHLIDLRAQDAPDAPSADAIRLRNGRELLGIVDAPLPQASPEQIQRAVEIANLPTGLLPAELTPGVAYPVQQHGTIPTAPTGASKWVPAPDLERTAHVVRAALAVPVAVADSHGTKDDYTAELRSLPLTVGERPSLAIARRLAVLSSLPAAQRPDAFGSDDDRTALVKLYQRTEDTSRTDTATAMDSNETWAIRKGVLDQQTLEPDVDARLANWADLLRGSITKTDVVRHELTRHSRAVYDRALDVARGIPANGPAEQQIKANTVAALEKIQNWIDGNDTVTRQKNYLDTAWVGEAANGFSTLLALRAARPAAPTQQTSTDAVSW